MPLSLASLGGNASPPRLLLGQEVELLVLAVGGERGVYAEPALGYGGVGIAEVVAEVEVAL